jgi:VWFA-related protein
MRTKTILFALGLCLGAQRGGLAQDPPSSLPDQVFRVTSELVVLDAQVLNRKTGLPVASLKAEDFEVFEESVKQEITSLSQDKLPLSIVFLFDLTDSVQPVLVPLAQGAAEALRHLKPEDEIAVMVYQAKAQLLQDFTTNRDLAVAAIERASTGKRDDSEAAYFNEGVYQAAVESRRATNPSSRRVIIWLTDSVPNVPSPAWVHTEQQALREVFESGAVVCSLLEMSAMSRAMTVLHKHNPMFSPSRRRFPPGDVNHYADQTGGLVLKSSKSEVATKLAELIDQIRSRYSLAYKPSTEQPAGKFCRTEVKLSRPAADREGQVLIRARRGYYR